MKRILSVTLLLLTLILLLTSCNIFNGNIVDSILNFHSYGEWKLTVDPTCDKDGEMARYCSCGEKETKPIPALGHTPSKAVIEDRIEPTYNSNGSYKEVVRCSVCNEKLSETLHTITMPSHIPGEAVTENVIEATCDREGSYDTVIYCSECKLELERVSHTTPKTEHTPDVAVRENVVEATCNSEGSHDTVIYCSDCNRELERVSHTTPKTEHTPDVAVRENVVEATCHSEGSHDTVIYCSDCNRELDRVSHTTPKTEHTPDVAVRENVVEATCHSEGSHDTVIYCSDCNRELDRVSHTTPKTEHIPALEVEENIIDSTCYSIGSKDLVVYCSDPACHTELQRNSVAIDKKAHTPLSAVDENTVDATCYSEGSYDRVIYCAICTTELSRTTTTLFKLPHTPATPVEENIVKAGCTVNGSYDEVVYCCVENCKFEISRSSIIISATGHNEVIDAAVAPTCTQTGLTQGSHCSVCRKVFVKQQSIAIIDHSYNEENVCTVCSFYLDGGLVFEPMGSSYSVISYTGNASTVKIPSLYNGKPVVEIGTYSFANNKYLTSVTIPDGVTRIGSDAFFGCSNLTSITLPDTLLSLEAWAFDYCPNLVYEQYDNAYYLGSPKNAYLVLVKTINKDIDSCEINPDTKFLYYSAFRDCDNLTTLTIPESVIHIGGYVFEYCDNLQYNEYDNAYYLGSDNNPYYALIEAKERWAITSCEINENTKLIAGRAFASCSKLTSIEIPEGIKSINFRAFECCYELTDVKIPDSVIYIEHEAFYHCDKLNSITIPDSVKVIGRSAFQSTPTNNVVLGSGVEKVDNLAFSGGSSNSKVYYNGTEDEWAKIYIEPSPSYMSGCKIDEYIRYYYSEEQPTASGRFWHYVDGVPTIW